MNYYNENDPKMVKWLRNLIRDGLIPNGVVDDRSIAEVKPHELNGYNQCHFFSGLGGWSEALRLAGVPDDFRLWTGSCPCQDFSNAGRKAGFEGERDLWPEWFRLIRECKPDLLFGEQVDDSPEWYDRAADDMESIDYTIGKAVVPACAVGAPHERARLWIVAHRREAGRPRLVTSGGSGVSGSWGWRGKEDLQLVANHPYRETDRWPQPLLRRVDDGVSGRVDKIAGFGNSIVPQVAAVFIQAFFD